MNGESRKRATDGFISLAARVWPYSALAFVTGVVLTTKADSIGAATWLAKLLEHVGIGLMVAAIVSLILHAKEVGLLFRDLARRVLVEHDYLSTLDAAAIRRLRSSASKALITKVADNPNYRREDLEGFIDEALFTSLFPGQSKSAGIYRENYVEDIEIELMSLAAALSAVGCESSSLPSGSLLATVCRQTSTARFVVVAPSLKRQRYATFPVRIKSWAGGLEHMPREKRVRFRAGSDSSTAQECNITFSDTTCGGIEYSGLRELEFVDGQCSVWVEVVEYKAMATEPFVLNTMAYLTRNLTVDVNVTGSATPLGFHAELMGGISQGAEVVNRRHGCKIKYEGWLLEDHGYFVSWW
jgi:hypothetical protein